MIESIRCFLIKARILTIDGKFIAWNPLTYVFLILFAVYMTLAHIYDSVYAYFSLMYRTVKMIRFK